MHQNKLTQADITATPEQRDPFTGEPSPWPKPKPWPKQGDRVRAASGREGDVLENINGRVKVDWGLYVTVHDAGELEFIR